MHYVVMALEKCCEAVEEFMAFKIEVFSLCEKWRKELHTAFFLLHKTINSQCAVWNHADSGEESNGERPER